MTAFPSIVPPSFGLAEEVYKPQIRVEFEANYVQSRPKFTRSRMRWPLIWGAMPEADYQTLKTFFEQYQGTTFDWTHPVTGVQYVCRFSEDFLKSTMDNPGFRRVECHIEEA